MALKYNTQLDTAKIKADADLDKMMMAGENKILEQATKSTNMFSQQVQGLNGNQRSGGEVAGSQPIPPSQAVLENKIFVEAIESLKKLYSEALLEKTGAKESDTRENFGLPTMLLEKSNNIFKLLLKQGNLLKNS